MSWFGQPEGEAMNIRTAPFLATAALIATIVTGCSAPVSQQATAGGVSLDKNRMQWVMPLDAYMVEENLSYAVDVLVEPCMQENGFDYQRPPVDAAVKSETTTVSGRNLFNVDVAKRWGYSGAPDPNADVLRTAEIEAREWPLEKADQYSACLEQARKDFPQQEINNYVAGLSISSWNGAKKDPEVVAAAEKWVQCMQPLGFTDLPDSPNSESGGTPTPSMLVAFGEVTDGLVNAKTPEQQAEEVRVATFDAQCQDSSGYAQTLYDAEWERQARVVEENEDALTKLLDEKAAYEKRAEEILNGAGA
jgi:hypothetical protein